MGVNWRTTVLFSLLLLVIAGTVAAQSYTGSLQGTIKGADDAILPGVTVTASSPALVAGKLVTVTDERGIYRFPSLPVGTYAIQAELEGFNAARKQNIRISIGAKLNVDFAMALGAVSETISVTAEAPVLSTVANTVASSFDTEYIETAPVPRNFYQIIKAAPGVNPVTTTGTSSGMLAYGGTSSDQNAFNLDGVNVASAGSGDYWLLPSIQWMEEIQVGGLGAAAEYGGYTGGVINGVTKSGGNEITGAFEYYYQPDSWVSDNTPDTPDDENKFTNLAVSLGGPLMKDRLWYFVAGEMWNNVTTALNATTTSERDIPRYLGKLTYQANEKNRLSMMAEYDHVVHERRGISEYTWEEASYKQDGPNFTGSLDWEGLINSENFVSLRFTGYDGRDDALPYRGFDLPGRVDEDTGVAWQNLDISQLNHYSLKSFDASWSLYKDGLLNANDSHNFKFGGRYEMGRANEEWFRNGGFTYYDWSGDCDDFDTYIDDPTCGPYYIEYGWGEYSTDTEFTGYAMYAQDSWKINRLTVNAGLRYGAYDGGFQEGYGDSSVYDVSFVDPRIGFVFDLFGTAKSAVKAHYGRYHNKAFGYLWDREVSGEGTIPDQDCYWDSETGGYTDCDEPTVILGRMGDVDHPYVDEILLSFEQQLGRTQLIGVDFSDRKFRKNVVLYNANDDYELIMSTPNPLTGEPLPIYNLLTPQDWVYTSQTDAYRDYQAVTARWDKRHSNRWSARASVVWTDLKGNLTKNNSYAYDWDDLNGLTNGDGNIDFSFNEWEAKFSAAVDLPFKFQLSGFYTYLSGWYWTPYVRATRGLDYNARTGRDIYMLPRGSYELPERNLIDLRLAWNGELPGGMGLVLSVEGFNIMNEDTVVDVYNRWGEYRMSTQQWRPTSSYGTPYMIERPREIRGGVRLTF